jgi:putative cell wall-binding protein
MTGELLRWLIPVVAVLAVAAGAFYLVEAYLISPLRSAPAQTETRTSATAEANSTTTTTAARRTDRVVAGTDRYGTAIAISNLGYPQGAPALVLATGEDYTEAVCAAPLAAAYGAPILLVPPEGIRTDLSTEIERLNPSQIFLVGVSGPSKVKRQLRDLLPDPEIVDLTADGPYETAALVAQEVSAKLGTVSKVVIAPSDSFAEAIAVSPLAAAKGWPILLSPLEGDTPAATTDAIEKLAVTSALVVGTTSELELADVERQVGADSYETAALVAQYALSQGMDFTHTVIVTGENFPDGLPVGPYLALDNGILLLAENDSLPPAILALFDANRDDIRALDFVALPKLAKAMALPSTGTAQTTGATETLETVP